MKQAAKDSKRVKTNSGATQGARTETALAQIWRVRQTVFGFLWAMAHIIDSFRQPSRIVGLGVENLLGLAVFIAAFWLIFRPSSTLRLGVLAAFMVFEVLYSLPIVPNHKIILLFLDLVILLSILYFVGLRKLRTSGAWYALTEPMLRLGLFVTYGSATLAKFNRDWFNPEISCANELPSNEFAFVSTWFGIDIPWTSIWILPTAIALAEVIVWLGLVFKRTRWLAIGFAVAFHTGLALTPVSNGLGFNFLLFPLVFLWLPDSAFQEVHAKAAKAMAWIKARGLVLPGFFLVFATATAMAFTAIISIDPASVAVMRHARYLPALALLLGFGATLVLLAIKHRNQPQIENGLRIKHALHFVLIAVVLFNSAAPYLGIKNYSSMTMYSNLQVGVPGANHLFIPSIQNGQTPAADLVEVVFTDNPRVSGRFVQTGFLITWHELQREMSQTPNAAIVYIRNGETVEAQRASDIPGLTETSWYHWLSGFRPHGLVSRCSW